MDALTVTTSDLLAIPALVLTGLQCVYFAVFHKTAVSRLLSLLFFLLTGFLVLSLASTFNFPPIVTFILGRLAILIPAVLWLLTFNLFSDEGEITWRFWILLVTYVVLQSIGSWLTLASVDIVTDSTFLYLALVVLPQVIMISMALHSLVLAVRGYYSDLIELRRVVRVVFVVCFAVLVVIVIGNGILVSISVLAAPNGLPEGGLLPDSVIAAYILVLMISLHFAIFRLRNDVGTLVRLPESLETGTQTRSSSGARMSADEELAGKIVRVMREEKLYREEKYTISQFADRLAIAEHKLRRIINKQLRYRNFNQFLNEFRVSEAAQRLVDSDTPISTIAYEAGFASLSVFNRAFKENLGRTPTDFRNSKTELQATGS